MINGIIMFSGGLDSVCATHLLRSQDLTLLALHFVLPFYSGLGRSFGPVRAAADKLGVPLRIIEEGEEYLPVIKNPRYGFGKNANPCVDCRIHRLINAKKIMEEAGASFIATGEVVGQRPMSQRMDCLHKIENRALLKGRILRPLSAKLLPPTVAEAGGLVDREKLLGIGGRGRKEQLAYARKFGLVHGTPAGGCFLTEKVAMIRFGDLMSHDPSFGLEDFKLLAYGRHLRLSPSCKLIVGRDDADNIALEKISSTADYVFMMAGGLPGPLGVLRGPDAAEKIKEAAAIVGRYSKYRNETNVKITVLHEAKESVVEVEPVRDESCDRLKI